MVRKIIILLVLVAVIGIFSGHVTALAEQSDNVRDYLDYLNAEELDEIQSFIDDTVENYGLDVVIVITDDTQGKTSKEFADDYYDSNGYGIGNDHSGILMLINMDIREVWISTTGKAIDIFTDNRINQMLDDIAGYLTDGNYYDACVEFVNKVQLFAEMGVPQGQYREEPKVPDKPYTLDRQYIPDEYYTPNKPATGNYWSRAINLMKSPGTIIAALVISVVATIIASLSNKGKVTITNRTYEESGSFKLTASHDDCIRETVSRVRISSNNPHRSSGGRSSVHRSSSGRTHGGGGRRF